LRRRWWLAAVVATHQVLELFARSIDVSLDVLVPPDSRAGPGTLFRDLPLAARGRALASARLQEFRPGDVALRAGAAADGVFAILSGRFLVNKAPELTSAAFASSLADHAEEETASGSATTTGAAAATDDAAAAAASGGGGGAAGLGRLRRASEEVIKRQRAAASGVAVAADDGELVATLDPGRTFGQLAFVGVGARIASVVAADDDDPDSVISRLAPGV
jgi:CRP-like cAMP-binding protein